MILFDLVCWMLIVDFDDYYLFVSLGCVMEIFVLVVVIGGKCVEVVFVE